MTETQSTVSRRTFVKGSLASLAAAGAVGSSLYGCTPSGQDAEPMATTGDTAADEIHWSQCVVNCGSACALRWHVRDGKLLYAETDNTGELEGVQTRACLRGRSMRRWLNSPDRLMYPMKRIGARGEGKFEQISWDEALNTIAEKLKHVIDTYGNEAIWVAYGSGVCAPYAGLFGRLANLLGGRLNSYSDYSTNMMQAAIPYLYGDDFMPYSPAWSSSFSEAVNSDLVIMFGNSPAETRMGGANAVWDFTKVRESGAKIYHIDYRMNETVSGHPDEWIPIRTGTDAALVAALAHELIVNDQVDKEFLDSYCVGYDEDTMPDSAKGQHKSYKDYIMGTGYDLVEKTPEWAAAITQIPADKIRSLAAEIAQAKALFVAQGWGVQRHSNGETACRAICVLPMLRGMMGKPGTNTGLREAVGYGPVGYFPAGENPVTTAINCYQWLNAVDHGESMTAVNDGVRGADQLTCGIKFIWNYAGNCITNQHSEINLVHNILQDESKLEFIVGVDTVLTDSAKYADILLPDAMRAEQPHIGGSSFEYYSGAVLGTKAQNPAGEIRTEYDFMSDLADRLGVGQEFTEGKTLEEWQRELYEQGASADPTLPTWDELSETHHLKRELPPCIGMASYFADPAANPLATPSGKIEIYSERLEQLAETMVLPAGETIYALPVFDPGFNGYGSTTEEFPLYCSGFHFKGRAHSSYGGVEELKQVARQQMWINPLDANERNIENGDVCRVKSAVGELEIEALVTPRIIPGTIGIPQGSWHEADMGGDRVDKGGCINTITPYHPSPLAKGNGVHSLIVQVTKA